MFHNLLLQFSSKTKTKKNRAEPRLWTVIDFLFFLSFNEAHSNWKWLNKYNWKLTQEEDATEPLSMKLQKRWAKLNDSIGSLYIHEDFNYLFSPRTQVIFDKAKVFFQFSFSRPLSAFQLPRFDHYSSAQLMCVFHSWDMIHLHNYVTNKNTRAGLRSWENVVLSVLYLLLLSSAIR